MASSLEGSPKVYRIDKKRDLKDQSWGQNKKKKLDLNFTSQQELVDFIYEHCRANNICMGRCKSTPCNCFCKHCHGKLKHYNGYCPGQCDKCREHFSENVEDWPSYVEHRENECPLS